MTSITVVITVYNGARFIVDALNSVFNQTQAAHEIIVVNDGSSDNSAEILRQFIPRIQIIDQKNAGVSAARNAGARSATGDYVAFLDQDDYWQPNKLERYTAVINELGAHKTPFIFSDFVREHYFTKERLRSNTDLNPWIFEHLKKASATQAVYLSSKDETFKYLLLGYSIYPSTMVVARSRLSTINWVENFRLSEDFLFSLLNVAQGSFTYIHQPLSVITRHDTNASLDFLEMAKSDIKALQWTLGRPLFSTGEQYAIRKSIGMRLARIGWRVRSQSRAEALRYYIRALAYPQSAWISLKGICRTLLPYHSPPATSQP